MGHVRHLGAAATLAGVVLLAGCSLPGGGIPASDPNPSVNAHASMNDRRAEDGRGALAGIFTRDPVDLPDAALVPMREATIERGYGGVIVRATGVAPTQGYFNATLAPQNEGLPDAAGVVTLQLMAVPPLAPEARGPERTRLLMTAAFLDELRLRGIRAVRVVSALDVATLPVPARPASPPPPENPPPEDPPAEPLGL